MKQTGQTWNKNRYYGQLFWDWLYALFCIGV